MRVNDNMKSKMISLVLFANSLTITLLLADYIITVNNKTGVDINVSGDCTPSSFQLENNKQQTIKCSPAFNQLKVERTDPSEYKDIKYNENAIIWNGTPKDQNTTFTITSGPLQSNKGYKWHVYSIQESSFPSKGKSIPTKSNVSPKAKISSPAPTKSKAPSKAKKEKRSH
jgi:hypothetical protein